MKNLWKFSLLSVVLSVPVVALFGGGDEPNINVEDLTRLLAHMFQDDGAGGRILAGMDDFDLEDSGILGNGTELVAPEHQGNHQGHPWGPNQPEFMNFFAMQGALRDAGIMNLRTAGVDALLERLGARVAGSDGAEYVIVGNVVDDWIAEAPAWRGPFMCVLRNQWSLEYPWSMISLEWAPTKASIEALVTRVHMLNI